MHAPKVLSIAILALLFIPHLLTADVADPSLAAQERDYGPVIVPLMRQYCYECHTGHEAEAEIDLTTFKSLADVRKLPRTWQKVDEMLASGQMPPKDAKQPAGSERNTLQEWVRAYLVAEAESRSGDPGRVVLRRLSNAEYTYTMRDLTSIHSLDPAHEFPVDGAAGEGFTNTGDALVMSPSLITKYLDAAKDIASHAVLLPGGIRFSPHTTRRDWTDQWVERIREFYRPFTDSGGGSAVNLQGIQFETNQGGRLPLEEYLSVTLSDRDALAAGKKTTAEVAAERGLNTKYLGVLWRMLTTGTPEHQSLLLRRVQEKWRTATVEDAPVLAADISRWQQALWKFNPVGHIGREGGPKAWLEPVSPLSPQQEFKLQLPESTGGGDVVLYLSAGDAGDGNAADVVVWKNPRLEGGSRPALSLRDAAGWKEKLEEMRQRALGKTTQYLAAAAEAESQLPTRELDVAGLASKHGVDVGLLKAWLDYLDIGSDGPVEVKGHFTEKLPKGGDYDFINGWGTRATPSISANSSDQEVRIPGIARAHAVVAHPSPTLFVAAGWRSSVTGDVRVEARVTDAHPECGNGVEWAVQHRTRNKVANLWQGDFAAGGSATMAPTTIAVRPGELVSLILGPRQGNHSCDLSEINLVISEIGGAKRVWDLAKDVSPDILESNPHADSYGNPETWHFYQGEMKAVQGGDDGRASVPPGSLLAQWQAEKDASARRSLAERVQTLAIGASPAETDSPAAILRQQLRKLVLGLDNEGLLAGVQWDARFGKHPMGDAVDSTDLVVRAPDIFEVRVPAELAEGRELVVTGQLDSNHGSVQLQVLTSKPEDLALSPNLPIIVADGSEARRRVESALEDFRSLFPAALCYTRIVPVDEVVTLNLFYREDEPLQRLMLDDQQSDELDRLWDELYFVGHAPLALLNSYEQITEFATQDRPDLVIAFQPLSKPINDRADAFRQRLIDTEPIHVEAVLELADRAWRRPLTDDEQQGLRSLYQQLREGEIPHEEAIRLTIARVLTSPAFLYRLENPALQDKTSPVSDAELATRLSYFLWSSMPDEELRRIAETGRLTGDRGPATDEKSDLALENGRLENAELIRQTRRMLRDERTRRLAIEFACQWLHIRDFDQNDEKNEKLYPEFGALREAMYEESVRFFEDMFRNDGSVLGLLDADHTFLNEALAKHYGIPWPSAVDGTRSVPTTLGNAWQRVEGIREYGRGGVLGFADILAKQSGASRTSPILRGNWVSETLLGERLPRPPANVPQLPDTVPTGLTARQLIERHSSVPECAKCHVRIDPYGFALEQYDAIGRLRTQMVDTKTKLADGTAMEGIDGLREYLGKDRRDDVMGQFCRKLLGYALGREVQLSDQPLLAQMQRKLESSGYRFHVAVEAIVTSRQFRDVRGRETVYDD